MVSRLHTQPDVGNNDTDHRSAGTAEETRYNQAHTLSDGGTPPFPFGLAVADAPDAGGALHGVSLNAGTGEAGVQLAQFPAPYPVLRTPQTPGTYAACNQTEPYYRQNFITVRAVDDAAAVPDGCVAVTLVPQCAELPALPAGSLASHEFANEVNCYEDVASIKWSEYGP